MTVKMGLKKWAQKSRIQVDFSGRLWNADLMQSRWIATALQRFMCVHGFPRNNAVERETRLELATSTLARLRSTN